ncbi:MAG TPA: glycosyltransferase [Tepidisphaeraceae bacterium]|jgi:glycosyltransferase involved in cell wall biosynthesis
MADNPLVSVLMPAYNARRYVAEAIESVLAQTYRDFEFLIIDDGSTDDTAEIVNRYAAADDRIRVLKRSNGGVGAALNAGLAEARGELVARMDSDDVCLPERFARQVEFLRETPDCVLVGCRVLLIDPDGEPLFEMTDIPTAHAEIDEKLLQVRWSIVHPTVMMRRDVVRRLGGYDNELVPVEDHDLFLRLAEVGRLANLPQVLLRYRKHPMNSVRVLADQRVKALTRVMEAAWARRGLTGRREFPAILPDIDRDDPRRDVKQRRNWGWQCLRSGNMSTARKYALAGLREDPLALESWKLMYCVLRGH